MIIVTPRAVDDDQFIGTDLTEDDYDEWATGTAYDRGDYVIVISTHSVYQCLEDHTSNATNSPTAEAAVFADPLQDDPNPAHWVRQGATNKWRLFDQRPTQRTEKADSMQVDLFPGAGNKVDTVGFLGLLDCGQVVVGVMSGRTGARLAWTEAVDGGHDIIDYEYRYRIGSGSWGAWTVIPDSDTTTTFFDVTGLEYDETDYEFELRAVNSEGDGTAASADMTSTTYQSEDDVPAQATGTRLDSQARPGADSTPEAPTSFTAVQSRVELFCAIVALNDPAGIVDWYSYLFADNRLYDQYLVDIPPTFDGDVVLISLTGGPDLAVGQIVPGLGETVGETVADNSGFETLDFSEAETNIYGDLTTIEREAVELYDFTVHTPVGEVSSIVSALRAQKGGKVAIWVGDDTPGVRGWNYGFLRDNRSVYIGGTYLRSQLKVQGVV